MATLTIRNLSEETNNKIRLLAAQNGHSMEEEVRLILSRTLIQQEGTGLGTYVNQQFQAIGGVELVIPSRSMSRSAPVVMDENR